MVRGLMLVCVLALLLLPLTLGAQSNPSYQGQDRSTVTQSNQNDRNAGQSDEGERTNRNTMQDRGTETRGERQDDAAGNELPATAGELPLLGLIGALSLAAAAGTRGFVRSR
jgi:hypothetical protein